MDELGSSLGEFVAVYSSLIDMMVDDHDLSDQEKLRRMELGSAKTRMVKGICDDIVPAVVDILGDDALSHFENLRLSVAGNATNMVFSFETTVTKRDDAGKFSCSAISHARGFT